MTRNEKRPPDKWALNSVVMDDKAPIRHFAVWIVSRSNAILWREARR